MKKIAVLSFCFLFSVGCSNAPTTVQQNVNSNVSAQRTDDLSTVSSRSQAKTNEQLPNTSATVVPKSDTKTKWTQSGNPIDLTALDKDVQAAQAALKPNPADENLKKSLAEAYVRRGIALTEARQYATALGDYRKALKLDSNNEEAKKWIDQIVMIYESINRAYPPEGEEPAPLPFKKDA